VIFLARPLTFGTLVLLLLAHEVPASERAAHAAKASAIAAADTQAAMADYRRKLAAYIPAWQKYDSEARAYWDSIAAKRRIRNAKRRNHQEILLDDYVLTQPPVYSGPPKPVDPSAVERKPPEKYVPVVADFLKAAAEHFQFVPQRPASEIEYKRAYAKIAAAAGLTMEQVVRIYGFEAGGNGRYDVQAGLESAGANARAISTALGYNQLLTTNSVELMAEQGDDFIAALTKKAESLSGEGRKALERKIAIVRRMVDFSRTVPDSWSEHEKLAATPQGLGVHAMVLDVDVGPLLQAQKLLNSVAFARLKGHHAPLSAAELEMMNLTGDGNGFDMVTMPAAMRQRVPTSNFFQRSGYERNPVAIRNNVVSQLLTATDAKMDREMRLRGARDLAAAF
jgi:hypothetical protein